MRFARSLRAVSTRTGLCAGLSLLPFAAAAVSQELPDAPTAQGPAQTTAAQHGTPGQISGQALNASGAVLSGAQVTLRAAPNEGGGAPAISQTVTTGNDGSFTLPGVSPGPYEVTVSFEGFTPVSQHTVIDPGQALVLPPFHLSLETVNISVNAITPEQAGIEEVRTEEHQRLVGLLPNFFVSYTWTAQPLTAKQKYSLATHTVLDPGNLVLSGLVAGVQQANNAYPGYGQGVEGYADRFGADLGNLVIGTYLGGAVLPSLFHQDPRYFYKGTGTKKSRFVYAISRAVITRGDNGKEEPNFSGILGDLSAGALSNLYYPASDRQGATLFLENSILAIAGDAMTDFVQEFVFNHFTLNTHGKKAKPQP